MERDQTLHYSVMLIALIAGLWALYHARPFLVPLSFAALLAMLMVPISNALERWGWRRMGSSLTSTLIMITLAAGLVWLLSSRASSFATELPRLLEQVTHQYQKLRQTVHYQWGIELPTQEDLLAQESAGATSEGASSDESSRASTVM
jgi:predicted PurR-regulated permease PerM